MYKAIIILFFFSSCQKEISCEDWGVCEGNAPKCVTGHSWILPAGNIDPVEHIVFTPSNNAYHILGHPDFVATWGDCMPMNLKDSAGYYKVMSKGVYRYALNESPYVQIGGSDTAGWWQHETSTYFFIMQQPEWDSITNIFKPRL